MPKFENKYCYCTWEDCLVGKKVFFADSIGVLKNLVENNDQSCFDVVVEHYNEDFPFYIEGYGRFAFCYWDPNYEFKVAFEQGKTIQALMPSKTWKVIENPNWVYPPDNYRIKPDEPEEKPVTNRELARWLAQGNGEICMSDIRLSYLNYEEDDKSVTEMFVRKWSDECWHRPTRQYLGLH